MHKFDAFFKHSNLIKRRNHFAIIYVYIYCNQFYIIFKFLINYNQFSGFETDEQEGLPPFWCSLFPYLATILPSIFHTAAIWLTVYLAVQRLVLDRFKTQNIKNID
jgi:hypothetical protein